MKWTFMLPLAELMEVYKQRAKQVRQALLDGTDVNAIVTRRPEDVELTVSRLTRRPPAERIYGSSPPPGIEKKPEDTPRARAEKIVALQDRLYEKLPEQKENRRKKLERKFLQPIIPVKDDPPKKRRLSSLVKKYHDHATDMKAKSHDLLLTNHLTKWENSDGKGPRWVKCNWREEANVRRKPMVVNEDKLVPLNGRFYEDRKPTGEVAERERRRLFAKHDTLPKSKVPPAGPEVVKELNNRFFNQQLADREAAKAKVRDKYLISPECAKLTKAQLAETIERLNKRSGE